MSAGELLAEVSLRFVTPVSIPEAWELTSLVSS